MCVLYNIPAIGIAATGYWPYGEVLCKIQGLVLDPVAQSIYILILAINVERYICIIHPLKYQSFFSVPRARLVVAISWLFVLLVKSSTGLTYLKYVIFDIRHQCCFVFLPESSNAYKIYAAGSLTFSFLPLVIVIFLYGRILHFARKSAERFNCKSSGQGRRTISPGQQVKRNIKGATTCFLLTLSVVFAMLPMAIIFTLELRHINVSKYIVFICHIAFQSGGIFNVIIYYLRNRSLNASVHQVLNSICKCRRS